jgi:hypothetical protein
LVCNATLGEVSAQWVLSLLGGKLCNLSLVNFLCFANTEACHRLVKKTEALMENFRRAIGMQCDIRRSPTRVEIQANGLQPDDQMANCAPVSAQWVLSLLGGKLCNLSLVNFLCFKKLRLDPSIYEAIQKERVTVGDVIYIEANTGSCKRLEPLADFNPMIRWLIVRPYPPSGFSASSGVSSVTSPPEGACHSRRRYLH